jgi:hypothetical protein
MMPLRIKMKDVATSPIMMHGGQSSVNSIYHWLGSGIMLTILFAIYSDSPVIDFIGGIMVMQAII